jgi:hypothetical protein
VRHRGGCPPNPHNPDGAVTRRIHLGEGYGGRPYKAGETFRDERSGTIVTVVAGGSRYHSDEGMSFGVGAETGYVYWADVRPATSVESAPVLAAEATAQRRRDLATRVESLFAWRYSSVADAVLPSEVDPASVYGLPEVPLCAPGARGQLYRPHLYVDMPNGCAWTTTHNGADGDDWTINNCGSDVVLRHPLTPERAQLVADLRGEYEDWSDVPDDAAAIIRSAGYGQMDLAEKLPAAAVTSAADATALVARTPVEWDAAGWRYPGGQHRWTGAEVARFADAGLTSRDVSDRYRAGFSSPEEILGASAPQLPGTPGRFILPGFPMIVTDDPAIAQQRIARRVSSWRTWQHHPHVTCVHAATEWQLWSDGAVTRAWYRCGEDTPPPQGLIPPAAELVAVAATAVNVKEYPRDLRVALASATSHSATVVAEHGDDTSGVKLVRHDGTLGDGTAVVVWEVAEHAGGWAGGDADYNEWRRIYAGESAARAWCQKARRG